MTAVRAVIVDDEPHARADLRRLLEESGVDVIAEASDGSSALQAIEQMRPDVVFLDIDMPGRGGLTLAASERLPPVVFVTAHPQHAPAAFDLDACDYLLKPLTRERLARAVERVSRRVAIDESKGLRLRVTDSKGTRFVDVRRIERFSAADKYVVFDIDGDEHLLRESLDALEKRLAPEGFARCHRAHLVRIAAIDRLEDGPQGLVLVLGSGSRVPVSKRLRGNVLRTLR